MIQIMVELCMFCIPGIITEQLYLYIRQEKGLRLLEIPRIVAFSMTVLMLRCMFAVAGGYDNFEISAVFHGTGNFVHYCFISIIVILFAPPCCVILQKIVSNAILGARKSSDFTIEGGENE